MTRMVQFNSPFLLGFDEMERLLEQVAKGSDGYPPYNVEDVTRNEGETPRRALRITLAVAGFARDELSVTVEDNQLVIRGRKREDEERVYLYRGIAARQFQRAFVLAEGIDVGEARLDNGLLSIDLIRPEPSKLVRQIEIEGGVSSAPAT
ncbi:Hsp20 family protein [Parvibaculum sp.]|uniref:Hsp20 family protein n=1 Tax=Parvibaculum sp. TaxID=2024848 RepID=UPI00320C1FFC